MNTPVQRTQPGVAEIIDLDAYVEDATSAFQQAVAANRDTQGLRPEFRGALLNELARALKLNPLTRPVIFLKTQGGESIYVTRQGADQIAARLRLNRETVAGPDIRDVGGTKMAFCQVRVSTPDGRSEMATATLAATDLLMVLMKVETKAKRRATLSIAGLGMLSEEDAEEMGVDGALDRTAPAMEPTTAQNRFALDLDDCTTNRDAVDAWLKHRDAITADGDAAREASWSDLTRHVMRLMETKKTAAEKYIRGVIAERDAAIREARTVKTEESVPEAQPETQIETPKPLDPPTLVDFTAQIGRCATLDMITNLWRGSRHELIEADRVPAWTAALVRLAAVMRADNIKGMGNLLKKRIAELDATDPDPSGPKGTNAHDTSAPVDVRGSGEFPIATESAASPAMRTVLDTDTAHLELVGTWRAAEAGWREHLSAISARRHLMNCIGSNGAALGPRFLELAAARLVAIAQPDPLTGARLTLVGATLLVERASLEESRERAAVAVQGAQAA